MAGLSLGMKCLKCSVFFFNIICFICALVLIIVGAYVQVSFSAYGPELQKVWQAAPITLIVLGVVILLVSFLGCCGAIKENVCMLYMYGALLLILLIGEIVAAVLAIVYKNQIDAETQNIIKNALKDYSKEPIKESIDLIQRTFKCCGSDGKKDYAELAMEVPESCGANETGCAVAFSDFLKQKLVIVAAVAFGVCLVQLLSTIIAFCLGNRIRNYENI